MRISFQKDGAFMSDCFIHIMSTTPCFVINNKTFVCSSKNNELVDVFAVCRITTRILHLNTTKIFPCLQTLMKY